jgi:hypothetical protein
MLNLYNSGGKADWGGLYIGKYPPPLPPGDISRCLFGRRNINRGREERETRKETEEKTKDTWKIEVSRVKFFQKGQK